MILVQSGLEPSWEKLPQSYLMKHAIKPFEPQASQLEAGRVIQFRLKANPSKRDQKTGKTIGLFHQSDQLAWLERQASRRGFILQGVDVIPSANVFGIKTKGTSPIRIVTVLYQGILQIADPSLFVEAIQQGIGRGKSYGCGLLSIAKLN